MNYLKNIDLNGYYKDQKKVLRSISEKKQFLDGRPTDIVEGYMYEVADPTTFDILRVSVAGVVPIMTKEELQRTQDDGKHTFIVFENLRASAYVNKLGKLSSSVKADGVKLVKGDSK